MKIYWFWVGHKIIQWSNFTTLFQFWQNHEPIQQEIIMHVKVGLQETLHSAREKGEKKITWYMIGGNVVITLQSVLKGGGHGCRVGPTVRVSVVRRVCIKQNQLEVSQFNQGVCERFLVWRGWVVTSDDQSILGLGCLWLLHATFLGFLWL